MLDRSTTQWHSRRRFLEMLLGGGCTAAGLSRLAPARADDRPPLDKRPKAPDHTLAVISGTPRERGRAYGQRFADEIRGFFEQEVLKPYAQKDSTPEKLLRYAAACLAPIRRLSPIIADELEGMAEGTGLRLEEVVLLTLHEELWHRGVLPAVDHCTAVAVGPPVTCDGKTYVGQNWDWFGQLYGRSQMLRWERKEGPSVLAYSYPGLWVGAGLNSAGLALCWTSTPSVGIPGPTIGIPSYVLLAHLLYQPSLEAVEEEAARAPQAGWFTFVMADGEGHLLNIEGSPIKRAMERSRGSLVRVYYGTREMTGTPPDKPVPRHPQCQRMADLVEATKGKLDQPTLQGFFGDHESTICKHFGTLDSMVFCTTTREAFITRGPGCLARWQRFTF